MWQIALVSANLLLVPGQPPLHPPSPRPLAEQSVPTPGPGFRVVAEAERTLSRLILGLDANETKYFLLPETTAFEQGVDGPHLASLRRQLYWLNFELVHGQIFRYAPRHSRFFLAVPERAAGSLGDEERLFLQYLTERVGWSDEQIRDRIRFFSVREPILFPQDMAEAIGYDDRSRLVLAMGLDCVDRYREPVERLVKQFPEDFVLKRMPALNTEGGDLAVARLPGGGGLGLLLGRNRIVRYLEDRYGVSLENQPLSAAQIEEARSAYREAFFGLEVLIVGESGLRDPRLANPELFHLDMVASVFRGRSGVVAFVPTYGGAPADALSHEALTPELVGRLQGEYDRDARQLEARGYKVARLPFADHPVRSPVGAAKFFDSAAQKSFVLLGRYPYHFELPGGRNPQKELQGKFRDLDAAVAAWRRAPTASAWSGVIAAIQAVWRELDRAATSPNPDFDRQREVYERNGVDVLPVPIFPTGEGGIHCLVLK